MARKGRGISRSLQAPLFPRSRSGTRAADERSPSSRPELRAASAFDRGLRSRHDLTRRHAGSARPASHWIGSKRLPPDEHPARGVANRLQNLHPPADLVTVPNAVSRTNPGAAAMPERGLPYGSMPGAIRFLF